jgi:hypothetical protein
MKYCLNCGFVGKPKQNTPGTLSMEVKLWLFFVVPGVIYSVWRRLATYQGCAMCRTQRIVPADSPVAEAALRKLSPPPSLSPWVCTACGEPIFSQGGLCERCATLASRAGEKAFLPI